MVSTPETAASPARPTPVGLLRYGLAAGILLALTWWGLSAHERSGGGLSMLIVLGAAFGWVLQRSRFCFFCMIREWLEEGEVRGPLGILSALAAGTVGYLLIFGAWIPDPSAGHLPPRAHIGPASWVVVLGGLAFGAGMSLSGSCISAHLYRLGEGSLLSVFALAGVVPGFMLGMLAWNRLWSLAIADAPPLWLPNIAGGYAASAAVQLALIAVLAILLITRLKPTQPSTALPWSPARLWQAVMVERWPAWLGGLLIGLIGVFAYLRTRPLGVTAELSRQSRRLGDQLGMIPDRLEGLDRLSGCIVTDTTALIADNGLFLIAMIAASTAAALLAGQFRVQRKSPRAIFAAAGGGVLLGFGAMIALGCSIGTLLSGISALAISGWLFAWAMLAGIWLTLPLRRRWLG